MSSTMRKLAVVAGGLLALGCSDLPVGEDGVDAQLSQQVDMDVLGFAGSAVVDDIQLMFGETTLFGGPQPADLTIDHDYSVSRTITFYDSTGAEMDGFDPLLTASVNIVSSISGSRSRSGDRGSMTVSVERERDVTVSGMLGDETERQWDGTGSSTMSKVMSSDERGTREYNMSATGEIVAVLLPVPRGSGWPISGTITREVTVEFTNADGETRTRERTVIVEFNGTRYVPIWINGEEFTLDLETREIVDNA